jgi:hypothetical protein
MCLVAQTSQPVNLIGGRAITPYSVRTIGFLWEISDLNAIEPQRQRWATLSTMLRVGVRKRIAPASSGSR